MAGVHAAFAVTAALCFADRTGVGQLVELPMIETVLNVTAIQPIEAEVFGVTLSRRGNRGHGWAVQNLYRCAGDDDWIAVTVGTDEQWQALVNVLGRPSWTDDRRFDTVDGRGTHADEIDLRAARLVRRAETRRCSECSCRRVGSGRAGGLAIVGHRERSAQRPRFFGNA